jgi:2-hydroxymuconate-semialdehyde hydrolase
MLHGSGAGTSTLSNWGGVLESLSQRYHVFAADLIGFGLSSKKPTKPYFDIPLWLRQAQFLFHRAVGDSEGGLIGHSLSGFLGLRLATANPKLAKLAVTGCPGAPFQLTRALELGWTFPTSVDALRVAYEHIVADSSALTDEFFRERLGIINKPGYADYFSSMFGGNKQTYLDQLTLTAEQLAGIRCKTLFVHGVGDRVIPFAEGTLPMVCAIPSADAFLINRCGHGPALEHPRKFMHAIEGLFSG